MLAQGSAADGLPRGEGRVSVSPALAFPTLPQRRPPMPRFFPAWFFRPLSATLFALLLCALLVAAPASAQQEMEVIPLRHSTIDKVLPTLRPLVEPGGAISGMNDQLILRASRKNREEIKRALEALDRPARSLVIHVAQSREATQTQQGGTLYGTVGNDNVRIVQPPGSTVTHSTSTPSGTVVIRQGSSVVGAQVVDTRSARSSSGAQSVRVIEGGRAFIQVGRAIPLPLRQVVVGPGGAIVSDSVVYRDVGQGFYAEPRLAGERVTLDIRPYNDAPGPGGSIQTQRLSTTVSGRLGEWIELGGTGQQANVQGQGGLSIGTREVRESGSVWLKVEEVQ